MILLKYCLPLTLLHAHLSKYLLAGLLLVTQYFYIVVLILLMSKISETFFTVNTSVKLSAADPHHHRFSVSCASSWSGLTFLKKMVFSYLGDQFPGYWKPPTDDLSETHTGLVTAMLTGLSFLFTGSLQRTLRVPAPLFENLCCCSHISVNFNKASMNWRGVGPHWRECVVEYCIY